MSDEQNHNDPLERLFRKKAEEYNISYREEDWLKLEKQLDARDMKLYYRRRLRWLAAASILIFSLIGYYTVQNHNKINELTEQLNQSEAVEQNDQPVGSNTQEDIAIAENQTNEPEGVAEGVQENEDTIAGSESEGAGQGQQRNAIVDDEPESGAASTEGQSEKDQSGNFPRGAFAEATETIQQKSVDPHQFFQNRALIPAFVRFENESAEARKPGSDFAYQPINTNSNGGSSAIQRLPNAASNSFAGKQSRSKAGSRIAVGIVLSPDLSTVGGVSNFDNPGFKGGVLAEYSLSKRFSLISGVAVSNVKYKASGGEYNPPQEWNYGVKPDQTTAVCVIVDIPVSLKSNLLNFDRSRIFATAGLSSYIMMNEDYQFQYDGNPAGLENSWNGATGTRHWFSNAAFSIGIEYDLSPTWSIRAEPHLKVPLKGVGWGGVELYSMGSFVSLNYRFGSL